MPIPGFMKNHTQCFMKHLLYYLIYHLAREILEEFLVVAKFLDAEVRLHLAAPVGKVRHEGLALRDNIGNGFEIKR